MAKINIYKRIHGSLTNKKGDGVLGYTEDYSDRTKLVSSVIDNPPVLSPNYATVIWRYYKNIDRYMYIHIQGSRFLFSDRNYPYRAAFEVNRKDMLGLAKDFLPLGCVVEKMPRILPEYTEDTFKNLGIEETVNVKTAVSTSQSEALAAAILQAIVDKKRLCISIGSLGITCKDNGVLETDYFKSAVAAIESLPQKIAQYVSFGVCIDDNHARFLDDVMVMFYSDEKKFTVPADAKNISWEDIIKKQARINKNVFNKLAKLVSDNGSSLLSLAEMMLKLSDAYTNYERICNKNAMKVKGNEWEIWLMEHSLQEIKPVSWEEFNAITSNMPLNLKEELASLSKNASLDWSLNEVLMRSLINQMNYSSDDKGKLQAKALPEYLDSACQKYAFLYDDNFNFAKVLNSNYLKKLNLKKPNEIKKWFDIFKKNRCLGHSEKKVFLELFKSVKISEFKKAVNMLVFLNKENLGVVKLVELHLVTEAMALTKISDLPLLYKNEAEKLGLIKVQYEELSGFIKKFAKDFIDLNFSVALLEDFTRRDKNETKRLSLQKEYFLNCLESDEDGILNRIFDKDKKVNFVETCDRMLACCANLNKKYKNKFQELNAKIHDLICVEIKDNYFSKFSEKKFEKLCKDFFNADKKKKYGFVCSLVGSIFKEAVKNVEDNKDLIKLVELTISRKNSEIALILYDILKEKSQKDDSEVIKDNLEELTNNFKEIRKKCKKLDFSNLKLKMRTFFSNRKNVSMVVASILLVAIVIAILCFVLCPKESSQDNQEPESPRIGLLANDTIDTTKDSLNLMLRLAEYIDDTVAVKLKDTVCVINVVDSTLTQDLWFIDSLYIQQNIGKFSTEKLRYVEVLKGEIKTDIWNSLNMKYTINVTEKEPLLKSVCQKFCRINSFYSGRRITIESKDSIKENNTYYAKYYLRTIKIISDSIKTEKNKIAY